jgi:DNA-binding NarL/FixJ family response regulator
MSGDTTVVLADDHAIFRHGLEELIEREPGLRVVGEADNGRAALALIASSAPDVAVLDLDMPELDGFAVARRARELQLPTRLVVLTMHTDELHFNQAIDLGVRGYVIKDDAATDVINCIKVVAAGGQYVSPALSSRLLRRGLGQITPLPPSGATFTPAERRVLALLADLKTTKQIAAELGVSPRTIDNHRANLCAKLNLQGPHALAKFAQEYGRARE